MDVVCARYGWTLDYALWGISYVNLAMMTHDAISVLTSFKNDGKDAQKRLNADDPANTEKILQQFGQI